MKKIDGVADLTPDPKNSNKGTVRGRSLLEESLQRYGAGRSILADADGVVIAGNKTLEVAAEMGMPVRVVQTDGRELIVVQRKDVRMATDKMARELAIADNRVAEVDLAWDPIRLAMDLDAGLDLGVMFTEKELSDLMKGLGVEPNLDEDGGGGGGDKVKDGPQFVLSFDSVDQEKRWLSFLKFLAGAYPQASTPAERLDTFISELEAKGLL